MLRRMVDPRDGFLAHERFPTIAALNDWFEKQAASFRVPCDAPEHRALPPPADPEIEPQEVRDAAVDRWRARKAQQIIAETASKMAPPQAPDTPEQRAALLETELMKGAAKA